MLSFITESARNGETFEETPLIGGFVSGSTHSDFDSYFETAADNLNNSVRGGLDIKNGINDFIKSDEAIANFKEDLLAGIAEESANEEYKDTYYEGLYDQCSALYDNTIEDLYQESTRVGTLLPIKAIDLPLCIKSHVRQTFNAIIRAKVTNSPVVKKQIERTWVIDPKTKKRYLYPQCLFNNEWEEIYAAGSGLPIKSDPVALPIFNYDIIGELTDAQVPDRENITIDLKIAKLYVGGTVTEGDDDTKTITGADELVLNHPITINLADGAWVGGVIKDEVIKKEGADDIVVNDVISGFTDFVTNTTTITSASGQITGVSFEGKLSNEKNERTVTFDYSREDKEWKIDDGFRVDAHYSLEELMDAKALAKMDLYKRSYNDLNELLSQTEDNMGFKFLDEMFEKYDGVEMDRLDFNPFVSHSSFDCDFNTFKTVAMPSEYIATMLKFKIDRFLIDIADECKLEGLTFVIYGNPRYVSLLDPNVKWIINNGQKVGGVKLDYSYGVMTSGDIKVNVVSVMKLNAKKYDKLRFVAFPTSELTITFDKFKYATHIATESNSAYRSADLPGGSKTYVVGTSRYKHICMQGIQADMKLDNADFIQV